MRIMTLNINGIRSGARKGFFDWFLEQSVDILCLQEIKAQAQNLDDPVFMLPGYERYLAPAEKKGYSGVAIYTKPRPLAVERWEDWPVCFSEGRYLELEYEQLIVASLYLPSGSSGELRQQVKFAYLDELWLRLEALQQRGKPIVLAGDWNIAHQNRDLKNWRANRKNSGFLPEERAWLDRLFAGGFWVDAFRVLNQEEGFYTWWSNRGRARENDVGWRIDYQIISQDLQEALRHVAIDREPFFSDHAPLTMDYHMP